KQETVEHQTAAVSVSWWGLRLSSRKRPLNETLKVRRHRPSLGEWSGWNFHADCPQIGVGVSWSPRGCTPLLTRDAYAHVCGRTPPCGSALSDSSSRSSLVSSWRRTPSLRRRPRKRPALAGCGAGRKHPRSALSLTHLSKRSTTSATV